MNIPNAIEFIVAMIIMMNPLGSMSIFLQLTPRSSFMRQRALVRNTTIAITIIMIITIWTGKELLALLGITIPSFRFAGGIILLLMGLSMLQSRESPLNYTSEEDEAAKERDSIAVVPMALPVIIGPGAISTMIIKAGDYSNFADKLILTFICLVLSLGMGAILYYSTSIFKVLGESVIKVVTRIMGMIVMAIAVEMLADGIVGLLPVLR